MNLIPDIVDRQPELTRWRRDIHAHPELAFAETRTADFVAGQLSAYGIDVTRGLGNTGVVGTLSAGSSSKAIGLRADMDALPMDEHNTFAHKSKYSGKMHGCGHDGHTVTLLAAARYLAQSKNFDGTVQLIFQPAEEANKAGSGARSMIEDGLFERFPVDQIFAFHNAPGLKAGVIATRPGPLMASMDLFDVTVTGRGCHGAMPHTGIDPINIAAHLQLAWQSIVSRTVDPVKSAVISPTSITTGESWSVIPDSVNIKGSVRTLSTAVRKHVEDRFWHVTQHVVEGYGGTVDIAYWPNYPVTNNHVEQAAFACKVAASVVGEDRVFGNTEPCMGSEDFGCMLEEVPGCYVFIGNSAPGADAARASFNGHSRESLTEDFGDHAVPNACMVHDPNYDFNDKIIPVAASFFVGLVEKSLR